MTHYPMKPRALNVDRMRRYADRTSPDELKFTLELTEQVNEIASDLIDAWIRRMKRKHGDDVYLRTRAWLDSGNFTATWEGVVSK